MQGLPLSASLCNLGKSFHSGPLSKQLCSWEFSSRSSILLCQHGPLKCSAYTRWFNLPFFQNQYTHTKLQLSNYSGDCNYSIQGVLNKFASVTQSMFFSKRPLQRKNPLWNTQKCKPQQLHDLMVSELKFRMELQVPFFNVFEFPFWILGSKCSFKTCLRLCPFI